MQLSDYARPGCNVDDLDAELAARLLATVTDHRLTIPPVIVSGYRTFAEQSELYRLYLARIGNLAARPGTSNHERGLAADVHTEAIELVALSDAAYENGLRQPVPGEPWHFELDPNRQPLGDPMTPQQLADALGGQLNPIGQVCVPLVADDLQSTSLYTVAQALSYIHQELKMARLGN
jgi:hypothetical protein